MYYGCSLQLVCRVILRLVTLHMGINNKTIFLYDYHRRSSLVGSVYFSICLQNSTSSLVPGVPYMKDKVCVGISFVVGTMFNMFFNINCMLHFHIMLQRTIFFSDSNMGSNQNNYFLNIY